MKQFKIGDKVIALTNPKDSNGQPRIKGHVYIVEDVLWCAKCGGQKINLGYFDDSIRRTCICGTPYNGEGKQWTMSKHFALVDDVDAELEEAVEAEDYEFAALLRDAQRELIINAE